MQHPGTWVTIAHIPRADKARQRLLADIGPKVLLRFKMAGRFIAHESCMDRQVRVMYLPPKVTDEEAAKLLDADKWQTWLKARRRRLHAKQAIPPERTGAGVEAAAGDDDDTPSAGGVKR